MTYDAFISYSHYDKAWALKLNQELVDRNFKIFLDQERLRAGDKWDPKLRDALIDSRYLLLLWSHYAATSDWVKEEAAGFRMLLHQDPQRKLIPVCLEGCHEFRKEFQMITDLSDAGQYLEGPEGVDPNLWSVIVEKIGDSLEEGSNLPAVNLVILASTRQRISNIEDAHNPSLRTEGFAKTLKQLGIDSRDTLLACYGNERWDWKPLGSNKSIMTILNNLRAKVLKRGAPPFRWWPVGSSLWEKETRVEELRAIVDPLKEKPSVIVLDALSLYDPEVLEQYNRILDSNHLTNESMAIVVPPPFSLSTRIHFLDFLKTAAERLFIHHFHPNLPPSSSRAKCSMIADDEIEMARLIGESIAGSKERHLALRARQTRQRQK